MGLPRPQLAGMKQGRLSRTLDNNSPPSPGSLTQGGATAHPSTASTLGGAESDMMPPPPNILHCMSDMLPRAPAPPPAALNPANVITASIDEGVEADILDRDAEAAAHSTRFAALQRDPYGLGLLPEYGYGYGYLDGGGGSGAGHRQSLSSANSSSSLNAAGLANVLSPFTSFDSSLEVDMVPPQGSGGGGGGRLESSSASPRVLSAHHMLPGAVPMTTSGNHSPYLQVKFCFFVYVGEEVVGGLTHVHTLARTDRHTHTRAHSLTHSLSHSLSVCLSVCLSLSLSLLSLIHISEPTRQS